MPPKEKIQEVVPEIKAEETKKEETENVDNLDEILDELSKDNSKEESEEESEEEEPNKEIPAVVKKKIDENWEVDEPVANELIKTFGLPDWESTAKEMKDMKNWKQQISKRGQEFNQKEAELNSKERNLEEKRIAIQLKESRIYEDLQTESKLIADFDKQLKDREDKYNKDLDSLNVNDDNYDVNLRKLDRDLSKDLSLIEYRKEDALKTHKSNSEKREADIKAEMDRRGKDNVNRLLMAFPDEFPMNEFIKETQKMNDKVKENKDYVAPDGEYPILSKISKIISYGEEKGIVDFTQVHKYQKLEQENQSLKETISKHKSEIDSAVLKAKQDVIAEIRKKGTIPKSYNSDEVVKKITTETKKYNPSEEHAELKRLFRKK